MTGDGGPFEPELVQQPDQVALVVRVSVGVAMITEPVPAEVERDRPQASEERDDAEPVGCIAGQAVEQDDGGPAPVSV